TTHETILCNLFAEILGLDGQPDCEAGFFALGGDSILAIQLVSRARSAGLLFSARDVFTQQSVARLALVAEAAPDDPHPTADDDTGSGDLLATPIMHWLRELGGAWSGFNQSMTVQVPAGADEQRLTDALQTVLDRHDALRLTARQDATGWQLRVCSPGEVRAGDLLHRVDARRFYGSALKDTMAAEGELARQRLDPEHGEVIRFVWFDRGTDRPGLLLVLVHHLAMDGVSWRILLPDLAAAWRGDEPGPVPASFRRWAAALAAAAPARRGELPRWEAVHGTPDPRLGLRDPDPVRDTAVTARSLTLSLPPELSEKLLTSVPAAVHAGVDDVLLTGLALAVREYRAARGTDLPSVLVDLEGHGRREIADGLDLSRTVGWFTTLHPVRLEPGDGSPGQALKRIKEQLRELPDHGIGYGMLRHLDADGAAALAGRAAPQLGFNYLGRFPSAPDPTESGWLGGADDWTAVSGAPSPAPRDPDMPVGHALEINAVTRDLPGGPELSATWTWPGELFTEDEVRSLATAWFAALGALADDVLQSGTGGLTPSDLSLAGLSQDEIDDLEAELRDLA
uniref:condensation domain-containing protein n=1 Tax=Streptomyces sp. KLOTTS4A1 TaxID=3390996 RepID=UPI0039F4EECF